MLSSSTNTSGSSNLLSVVLVGIPGVEALYSWILVFFCLLGVLALGGNLLLILIIKTNDSLQTPMYDFVSMLAIADLALSLVTFPTVLGVFSSQSVKLSLAVCLAQMFFVHFLSVAESSVLLVMAYDRLVAICNPLRYSSLLTNQLIRRLGLFTVLRGLAVMLPIPIMLKRSSLCKGTALSHAFCLHPDLMRLLCSNITTNNGYSIFAVLSTMGVDALLILLSYALILRAICRLSLASERWKAFNTCACHISLLLFFYTPMISLSMIHRLGGHTSSTVHAPMAYIHFLLPPALNPIIYGIKTKKIYQQITRNAKETFLSWMHRPKGLSVLL
ncbi:olfactory receptor 51G2-like [Hyperolius riggenbachi]|uniref:olfactory receptor 51G2-like n=1 Tax=Hyperolius riggenbachi TaxID=752182 RepID=UPI0035A36918